MKPLLVLGPMKTATSKTGWQNVKYRYLNAVLGALQGLYTVGLIRSSIYVSTVANYYVLLFLAVRFSAS